jgi:(4-(4-[2-(gamma-L-glutamylamino)ethyl]phenoxymethyl)furan-2-yl)methanamine synthase
MRDGAVIGWDVGGAHLKAARLDRSGRVEEVLQVACPLWQGLHHLDSAIEALHARLGTAPLHAVTMTGEMVDLFPDRAEGVSRLVDAIEGALRGSAISFYAGARGFLDAAAARRDPGLVASANWMASAELVAARKAAALFVDIGSTTTDIIAVRECRVCAEGRDDATRLISGELVYTGVVRTPLMALTDRVPFEGESVPLMAEYFATAADVYRILGSLPEGADQHPAADGGEKSVEASARRMARMIGRDAGSASPVEWRRLAVAFAEAQQRRIAEACSLVASRANLEDGAPLVAAGVGRFLAGELAGRMGRPCLDFATLLPCEPSVSSRASDCAPAVAVAWLALQLRA